jgi:hypothetical protein
MKLIVIISLFLFAAQFCQAQLSSSKSFSNKSGFCSTTFILDSLGNFYRESGCEGRSYLSYGKYLLRNGVVEFRFESFDSINIYREVRRFDENKNDSIISIQFLTISQKPVPNTYFTITARDSINGKGFLLLKLDENGKVLLNIKRHKEFRISYLEKIFSKQFVLPPLNSNLVIVLNLPTMFFYYNRPKVETSSVFSLLLKADGLYELNGKEKVYDVLK